MIEIRAIDILTDFEIEVLGMLAGRGPAIPWGAALGAALGMLKAGGLVELKTVSGSEALVYSISERGRNVLASMCES